MASTGKKLPLQSMLNDRYELLDIYCVGARCFHRATVRIADLVAAGVDPAISMSDLPMRCTMCGNRGVDARTNTGEFYDGCDRRAGKGKYAKPGIPLEPPSPPDPYANREDIRAARLCGRYP